MKAQHTPGPWRSEKWEYRNGDVKQTIIGGSDAVAQCLPLWRNGEDTTAEQAFNAALIAAAPELLEALEGCMKALDRLIYKHDRDSIEAEWIRHAHEAIAKAKGDI